MKQLFWVALFFTGTLTASAETLTCKQYLKSLPKEERESRMKSIPKQWLKAACDTELSAECLSARAADGDGAGYGDADCVDGESIEMVNTMNEAVKACKDHDGVAKFTPPACTHMACEECK